MASRQKLNLLEQNAQLRNRNELLEQIADAARELSRETDQYEKRGSEEWEALDMALTEAGILPETEDS